MPEVVLKVLVDSEDDVEFYEDSFLEEKRPLEDKYSWLMGRFEQHKPFGFIESSPKPQIGFMGHLHRTHKAMGLGRIGYKGGWYISKGTAPQTSFRIEELGNFNVPINYNPEVDTHFKALTDTWRLERRGISSTERMLLCPSYQRIIGLGLGWKDQVIRLIMRELQERPDFWFAALRALTGEDPVSESERGNVRRMSEAWLKWGRDRNFLGATTFLYGRSGLPEFGL
jgi:hypothetical protein